MLNIEKRKLFEEIIESSFNDDYITMLDDLCEKVCASVGDKDALFFARTGDGVSVKGKAIDELAETEGLTSEEAFARLVIDNMPEFSKHYDVAGAHDYQLDIFFVD